MFGALLRLNYYDGWETTGGLFGPARRTNQVLRLRRALLVDVEARLKFADTSLWRWAARTSSTNIRTRNRTTPWFLGVNYALTSPYGFNGGFYYLRLGAVSDQLSRDPRGPTSRPPAFITEGLH